MYLSVCQCSVHCILLHALYCLKLSFCVTSDTSPEPWDCCPLHVPCSTPAMLFQVPALAGAAGDGVAVGVGGHPPVGVDADGLGGSWQDLQQLRAQSMRVNALTINNQVSEAAEVALWTLAASSLANIIHVHVAVSPCCTGCSGSAFFRTPRPSPNHTCGICCKRHSVN